MSNAGQVAVVGTWFMISTETFNDPDVRRAPLCPLAAWLHVVGMSTQGDDNGFTTTSGKLAKAWWWEIDDVRKQLKRWERRGVVRLETSKRHTTIYVTHNDTQR